MTTQHDGLQASVRRNKNAIPPIQDKRMIKFSQFVAEIFAGQSRASSSDIQQKIVKKIVKSPADEPCDVSRPWLQSAKNEDLEAA